MAKKLFFGGISFNTVEETLRELCAQFGTVVSVTIITDKFSGRSKGYAFIEMSSDEEAAKVMEELNGKEVDGRTISVNEARPQQPRDNRGGGGRRDFDRGPRRDSGDNY